jgi:hypothetical protein
MTSTPSISRALIRACAPVSSMSVSFDSARDSGENGNDLPVLGRSWAHAASTPVRLGKYEDQTGGGHG